MIRRLVRRFPLKLVKIFTLTDELVDSLSVRFEALMSTSSIALFIGILGICGIFKDDHRPWLAYLFIEFDEDVIDQDSFLLTI